ncbi:hypothetical protein F4677DRAFT_464374 [Hypoxylon crocopeplum]|nr:hypothetical protein F4677DRAFT_464374 [Hypoxylon crocopeplum]
MSTNENNRPTPQSLPRLRIPTGRHKTEPEEITVSRVDEFLDFCWKHKKAPLTRLPTIPLLPPPDGNLYSDSDSEETKAKDNNRAKNDPDSHGNDAAALDTLAFTDNEVGDIEAIKAKMEEAKAQHTEWVLEMQADPKDRNALNQCRHWRKTRERLTVEMELILERRDIRRRFRQDYNHIKGLTNW